MAGQPGEATSAVAVGERAAHRGRDAAGAPPDAQRLAVRAIHHRDDSGVAAQPPGGLCRDGGAVLDFAAPGPAIREHFRLDMNHDFVPVRRERWGIARLEHPLCHPRQRIGAANCARRPPDERPTWDVGEEHPGDFPAVSSDSFRSPGSSPGICDRIGGGCVLPRRPTWDVLRRQVLVVPPRRGLLLRMRRHRRIERAQDARTHLGREPPVRHHGAVVVVPEGEAAALVPGIGPFGLLGTRPGRAATDLPAVGDPQDQHAQGFLLNAHHDASVADSVSP